MEKERGKKETKTDPLQGKLSLTYVYIASPLE